MRARVSLPCTCGCSGLLRDARSSRLGPTTMPMGSCRPTCTGRPYACTHQSWPVTVRDRHRLMLSCCYALLTSALVCVQGLLQLRLQSRSEVLEAPLPDGCQPVRRHGRLPQQTLRHHGALSRYREAGEARQGDARINHRLAQCQGEGNKGPGVETAAMGAAFGRPRLHHRILRRSLEH